MASPYGFNIDPGTTAEDLAMRRRIGEQLLMEASGGRPIKHWAEGLNRIAQGLVGGYDVYKATEADKAQNAEAKALLGGLFDLGDDQAPATPAAVPGAAGGRPMALSGDISPRASPAARAQVGNVTDRIIQAESGGRSNLRNPNSSASGPGQFTDSTWLEMIGRHRPDLLQGRSRDQVLAMRTDPAEFKLSQDMTAAYEQENGARLRAAGLEATPANLYAMHFFGPGDGIKVLKADPNTPLARVVSPASMRANSFLGNMTAGQAQRWASRKVGRGDAAPASASSGDGRKERRVQRAVALWGNPQTRPLAQAILAKYLGESPTDLMREYELARSQGYSGSVLDYQKELKAASKADSMLTDDLKEYHFAVGQGFKGSYAEWEGLKKNKGLSPGDKKAINEAEDAIPVISGTLDNLREALRLNSLAFSGAGAETGAAIGTSGLPGAGYLVDTDRAKATREWLNLMRPESIQTMANTLSGATTNFELQEFVKVLSDPSTPVDVRGRTIERMIKLAEGKERIAKERLQQIREGTYYQPGGGRSEGEPVTQAPSGATIKWEKGPDGIPRRVQ